MPEIPFASWNECTLTAHLLSIVLNSSWILSKTSPLTSSVCTSRLFESCRARLARFDAIPPQPAYVLPRCGVPRKTINLVRLQIVSDLCSAYIGVSIAVDLLAVCVEPHVFRDDSTKTMRHEHNWILCGHLLVYLKRHRTAWHASLSISLSNLTEKSRPCCETLFWLFAWKSPPITSALYPYVHIRAWGRSGTRYSSGQKISDGGEVFVCLLSSVSFLLFLSPKRVLMFLWLSVRVSVSSMRPAVEVDCICDHVPRGCPLRPWTKMMLLAIRTRCG
jgi:hypothetical protein